VFVCVWVFVCVFVGGCVFGCWCLCLCIHNILTFFHEFSFFFTKITRERNT